MSIKCFNSHKKRKFNNCLVTQNKQLLKKEYAESKSGKINVFVHSKDDIININENDNEILNDFDMRLEHFERRAITKADDTESFLSLIC